jgi:hypothetical protein
MASATDILVGNLMYKLAEEASELSASAIRLGLKAGLSPTPMLMEFWDVIGVMALAISRIPGAGSALGAAHAKWWAKNVQGRGRADITPQLNACLEAMAEAIDRRGADA